MSIFGSFDSKAHAEKLLQQRLARELARIDPTTGKLPPESLRLDVGQTMFGQAIHVLTEKSVPGGAKWRVLGFCGSRLDIHEQWIIDAVFSDKPPTLCGRCDAALLRRFPHVHLWHGQRKLILPDAA